MPPGFHPTTARQVAFNHLHHLLMVYHYHLMAGHMRIVQLVPLHRARITLNCNRRNEVPAFLLDRQPLFQTPSAPKQNDDRNHVGPLEDIR